MADPNHPNVLKKKDKSPPRKSDQNKPLSDNDGEAIQKATGTVKKGRPVPWVDMVYEKHEMPCSFETYVAWYLSKYIVNSPDYDIIKVETGYLIKPSVHYPPFDKEGNLEYSEEVYKEDVDESETNAVISPQEKQDTKTVSDLSANLEEKCLLDPPLHHSDNESI